jgi:hypothetical protein
MVYIGCSCLQVLPGKVEFGVYINTGNRHIHNPSDVVTEMRVYRKVCYVDT